MMKNSKTLVIDDFIYEFNRLNLWIIKVGLNSAIVNLLFFNFIIEFFIVLLTHKLDTIIYLLLNSIIWRTQNIYLLSFESLLYLYFLWRWNLSISNLILIESFDLLKLLFCSCRLKSESILYIVLKFIIIILFEFFILFDFFFNFVLLFWVNGSFISWIDGEILHV